MRELILDRIEGYREDVEADGEIVMASRSQLETMSDEYLLNFYEGLFGSC